MHVKYEFHLVNRISKLEAQKLCRWSSRTVFILLDDLLTRCWDEYDFWIYFPFLIWSTSKNLLFGPYSFDIRISGVHDRCCACFCCVELSLRAKRRHRVVQHNTATITHFMLQADRNPFLRMSERAC